MPGRSGTTYLAAALGAHPAIATFPGVELKILFERDGLVDLGWVLCETFSPNRAWVGLARFRTLMNQLRNGGFDQPLLAGPGVYSGVNRALERFYKLIAPEGVGLPLKRAAYRDAARCFFFDLAYLGIACNPGATHFLEKTPHNLLAPQFLADFVGLPWCVHVIRDPRATAWSLMAQDWGPKYFVIGCILDAKLLRAMVRGSWPLCNLGTIPDRTANRRCRGRPLWSCRSSTVCPQPRADAGFCKH